MAYRQPSFLINHPLAQFRQIADITGSPMSDADKRSLIDYRQGVLAAFSGSSASHSIFFDFGAAVMYSHCIIPAGHNFDGHTATWASDDNSGYSSATARGNVVVTDAEVIAHAITPQTTPERYWRIDFGAPAFIGQFSEVWFGDQQTLSGDAWVANRFDSSRIADINEVAYPGGSLRTALAPPRRTFTLRVRNLVSGSADDLLLESVLETGQSAPFWYWPPDSTSDPGPYLVQLTRGRRYQETKTPSIEIRYQVDLELEEFSA